MTPKSVIDAARLITYNALKTGRIKRPANCERCSRADLPVQGHHPDYFEPLRIEWLCILCHLRVHGGSFKPAGPHKKRAKLESLRPSIPMFLTPKDVATAYGVSLATVRNALNDGTLKAFRLKKTVRVSSKDLPISL